MVMVYGNEIRICADALEIQIEKFGMVDLHFICSANQNTSFYLSFFTLHLSLSSLSKSKRAKQTNARKRKWEYSTGEFPKVNSAPQRNKTCFQVVSCSRTIMV